MYQHNPTTKRKGNEMKSVTLQSLTEEEVKEILASSATHKLVYQILELAKDKDSVDVYFDTLTAALILKSRI